MQKQKIKSFQVIGIAVRTTNENGQAASDIGSLWGKFMTENILQKIPNRLNDDIIAVYTNFESDHTKPYDTILGCKVSTLDLIPEHMTGVTIAAGTFSKFISKGDIAKGSVYQSWVTIWNTDLDRLYTADFEVYGEKAKNPTAAEVDIYVAVAN